jgi:transposase
MCGPRPLYPIVLSSDEEQAFRRLVSSRKAAQGEVVRARILLAAHEHPGWSNVHIAREVGCSVRTVWKWRQRWTEKKSFADLPRSGAPRRFSP